MEVTVESITGRRTKLSNIDPSETVRGLKTRLWKLDGVPIAQQSLVFRDQALDDERTLRDYQVVDGVTIRLILITRSGPINRRVELQPKRPDMAVRNSAGSSENAKSPSTSFYSGDSRHTPETSATSSNSSMTVRRYTRQQMRQAQIAASQFAGKGDPLSSDVEQQSSSSLIDLTFTPERQLASIRRADENLRTMQRMRELRRSIERLSLEKSQRQAQQRNSASGATVPTIAESAPPRSRRPTGGSGTAANQGGGAPANSTGAQRSRSSTQLLVSSNDRHSAAAAAARAAYAADDTSAKESSAGETEIEDVTCYRQLSTSNTAAVNSKPAPSSSANTKPRNQPASQQQLVPPVGFKSKQQLYRNIRRSSCSDVDVESSAVWSSDADADAVFHNDRSREELYTADDLSFDEEDWNVVSGRQEDGQKATAVVDSSDDYEDANGDYDRRLDEIAQSAPIIDERNLSSGEDDVAATADGLVMGGMLPRSGGQDVSSDPSELSSGVVVCELSMALNNRRVKVKRKSYHTPRHTNKGRPQTLATGIASRGIGVAGIDETDDQSPLESPVKYGSVGDTGRIFMSRFVHHGATAYRDHHHLHAGYVPGTSGFFGGSSGGRSWRGRPRSKQRLVIAPMTSVANDQPTASINLGSSTGQQVAANSTTTGESSSDDHEDTVRRDSQTNANATASSTTAAAGRSTGHGHKPPQSSQSQQRCNACACRLSVATTFQCRCGKTVCLRHRHADLHSCTLLAAAAVSDKK